MKVPTIYYVLPWLILLAIYGLAILIRKIISDKKDKSLGYFVEPYAAQECSCKKGFFGGKKCKKCYCGTEIDNLLNGKLTPSERSNLQLCPEFLSDCKALVGKTPDFPAVCFQPSTAGMFSN